MIMIITEEYELHILTTLFERDNGLDVLGSLPTVANSTSPPSLDTECYSRNSPHFIGSSG